MQEILSVFDLLRRNSHWWLPIISSIYELHPERRTFDKDICYTYTLVNKYARRRKCHIYLFVCLFIYGARRNKVGWDIMLQAGRSRVRFPMSHWILQLTQSFQSHYGPGVGSSSNRNEYQESSLDVKRGRRLRLTILLPPVSRLSRKCDNLDVLQPYKPPRPVTGLALLTHFICIYIYI
jgi:hypothetical protein